MVLIPYWGGRGSAQPGSTYYLQKASHDAFGPRLACMVVFQYCDGRMAVTGDDRGNDARGRRRTAVHLQAEVYEDRESLLGRRE